MIKNGNIKELVYELVFRGFPAWTLYLGLGADMPQPIKIIVKLTVALLVSIFAVQLVALIYLLIRKRRYRSKRRN